MSTWEEHQRDAYNKGRRSCGTNTTTVIVSAVVGACLQELFKWLGNKIIKRFFEKEQP